MKKSHLLGPVCACLIATSFSASAVLVNEDWNGGTDNLTWDTDTGLRWLDLTESNNLSRDYVITQLGSSGDFEGFRYATNAEVVTLWSNFGIDLSAGAPEIYFGLDADVADATAWLGNPFGDWNPNSFPYGALGVTSEESPDDEGNYTYLGAYQDTGPIATFTRYITISSADTTATASAAITRGHYLVAAVPVPPAILLFGSGLLGLVGVARRKKA